MDTQSVSPLAQLTTCDIDTVDKVKELCFKYANWYAKECLKIAAEKAKIRVREFHEDGYSKNDLYNYLDILDNSCGLTDGDGCLYQVNAYDIDSLSILNIQLPDHDN